MIPVQVTKNIYIGNGQNKQWPFTFRYNDASDVKVALYDIQKDRQEVLTKDYFVDTEKNVVFYPGYTPGQEPPTNEQPAILAADKKLIVYRQTPQSQEKDLGDRYPLNTLEGMVDKNTMLIQEVSEKMDRAVLVDMGSDTLPENLMDTLKKEIDIVRNSVQTAMNAAESAENSKNASQLAETQAKESQTTASISEINAADSAQKAQTAAQNAAQDAINMLKDQLIPVGSGHEFYGDTPPTGYLFCDGMAVSRTDYAKLFAVIGTKYGAGDGSTTFNLPNRRSRVGVGLNGADGDFNALGKAGGEKAHTLNVNEMPSHGHGASTDGQGLHSHNFWAQGDGGGRGYGYVGNGANWQGGRIDNNGNHGHNVYIANTGGNQPHNNMPPYLVCNYIIKY